MNPDVAVTTVAHGIQLAVAPVFLLTGIGAMLGVLTNRLSRIIDRGRVLESARPKARTVRTAEVGKELATLVQRRFYVNWAITLCTTCALLICIVIVTLFAGAFLDWDVTRPIGILFIAAMLVFIGGLLSFLREIYLASSTPHFLRR